MVTIYNGLPMSTFSTQLVFDYQNNKLKNGSNRSVWEVDLYENTQPSAQISADKLSTGCLDNTVYFVDHSAMINDNATWEWSFSGGIPSTSNEKNPIVTYDQEGTYDVALTITNSYGTDTQLIPNFINYSNDPLIMEGFDCNKIVKIILFSIIICSRFLWRWVEWKYIKYFG